MQRPPDEAVGLQRRESRFKRQHPGPDRCVEIAGLVLRHLVGDLGRCGLNVDGNDAGHLELILQGLSQLGAASRHGVFVDDVQRPLFFFQFIDEPRSAEDRDGAIVHGGCERGAREHQSIQQRDVDAGLAGALKHANHTRLASAMQKQVSPSRPYSIGTTTGSPS